MKKQTKVFVIGDRVAYSAAWIKSTMTHYRGSWRGTVKDVSPFAGGQLVTIAWDGIRLESDYHDDGLGRVISPNLTLVSRIGIDSALNT